MERLRTQWAALAVALLLLISVAGVAGATHRAQPSAAGAPQVQAAPAEDEDQDEDADETTDEDTDTDETTDEDTDTEEGAGTTGAQGEHGALVSAAAHLKDCVGGKNHNHGGAVSQVARGEVTEAVCDPATAAATTEAKTKGGKSKDHRKDARHRP